MVAVVMVAVSRLIILVSGFHSLTSALYYRPSLHVALFSPTLGLIASGGKRVNVFFGVKRVLSYVGYELTRHSSYV